MAEVGPLTESWTSAQVEVMQRLRDWAVGFGELHRHLAVWMRLPVSDAHALGQITWAAEAGTPLSPAELSRRIAMTTGATTILLNRLEDAGHVLRSRESSDRRRVTLRPTPAAREHARRFLSFAGAEIAATLHAADPEELRVVATFLSKIAEATGDANRRLDRGSASDDTP